MFKEFKEFAFKGNVIDMAIGIIIGGAFGTVVKSLVDNVMMPPLGMITGKVDFKDKFVTLNGETYATIADAEKAGAPLLKWGQFITDFIAFILLAFAVFLVVKKFMSMFDKKQAEPEAAPAISKQEELLTEIRDLLKKS